MKPLRLRIEPPGSVAFDHESAGASLVLGRSTKADISIADRFLSRLHARLYRDGDAWFLESLGAKNATLLNGRPVAGSMRVASGDVVRLGETVVRVEPGPAPPPGPAEIQSGSSIFKSALTLLGPEIETGARERDAPRVPSRLKVVNEVHRGLAAAIGLTGLLELLLDYTFEHLRPEDASVFLKGADGELARAASRRLPGIAGDFLCSKSLAREVTEKGLAALVQDAMADERFSSSESLVLSGVRSLVAAPLLDSEGCVGMVVLTSRAHVRRFSEEDLELLVSLASAAALRIRNIALTEDASRHRLLEKEIELAHDIQMGMLPKDFPSRPEFELAAALRPARSVGGDLYDFLESGGHLWFLVGDVAGKGFPAALLMAVTKTLFHALAQAEPSPSAVLSGMNRELGRDNQRAMFVTAFAGRLDMATGELAFGNAGHNRPYLLGGDGSVRQVSDAAGVAMGVIEGFPYETGTLRLAPGELLYLYTDGVTEALDPAGEQYGEARLERRLRDLAGAPAGEVVTETLRAVQQFVGPAPPSDDIAVMALRYLGGRPGGE